MKPDFKYTDFLWWIGKVEDVKDPKMLGRVKVKIYGYYDKIEKDDLPWAMVMGPIQSSSLAQVGYSPTGLQEKSTVVGFFLDGDSAQVPLVIGTLYGEPGGENDVKDASREIKNTKKNSWGAGELQHPGTTFAAKYPNNHTITGSSGMLIEMDNTPGSERLSYEMPSGTWFETDKEGNNVSHVKKDNYRGVEQNEKIIIGKNKDVFIGGDCKIHIVGNCELKIDGNYDIKVGGNYSVKVGGNTKVTTGGTTTETSGGNHTIKASKIFLN